MTTETPPDQEDFLLTSDAAFRAGYCSRGLYRWLDSNGFNIRDAMKNGVMLSEIKKVNDAFSQSIVAFIEQERKKANDVRGE